MWKIHTFIALLVSVSMLLLCGFSTPGGVEDYAVGDFPFVIESDNKETEAHLDIYSFNLPDEDVAPVIFVSLRDLAQPMNYSVDFINDEIIIEFPIESSPPPSQDEKPPTQGAGSGDFGAQGYMQGDNSSPDSNSSYVDTYEYVPSLIEAIDCKNRFAVRINGNVVDLLSMNVDGYTYVLIDDLASKVGFISYMSTNAENGETFVTLKKEG